MKVLDDDNNTVRGRSARVGLSGRHLLLLLWYGSKYSAGAGETTLLGLRAIPTDCFDALRTPSLRNGKNVQWTRELGERVSKQDTVVGGRPDRNGSPVGEQAAGRSQWEWHILR